MTDWPDFDFLLGKVRRQVRGAAHAVHSALGDDPFEVLAHRGFGNGTRAYVYGRALEIRNVSASTDSDSTFRNLLNTYFIQAARTGAFGVSEKAGGRGPRCWVYARPGGTYAGRREARGSPASLPW